MFDNKVVKSQIGLWVRNDQVNNAENSSVSSWFFVWYSWKYFVWSSWKSWNLKIAIFRPREALEK